MHKTVTRLGDTRLCELCICAWVTYGHSLLKSVVERPTPSNAFLIKLSSKTGKEERARAYLDWTIPAFCPVAAGEETGKLATPAPTVGIVLQGCSERRAWTLLKLV